MESESAPRRTVGQKLEHLFHTVRRPDGREYGNEEVAALVSQQGETISSSYIWYLRTGQRDNPTLKHLTALARFFGVPAAYFFDDEMTNRVEAELALLTAMNDAGVRGVALRAAGLSPESLRTVYEVISRVSELEGKTPRSGEKR
ncbi:helix-turn-helix domain-containing protein [Actinocrispum wychmicini]|uniref:helix-turn-helix domain-containing protein n=1 Tax=Actinocrispum wychmicini TaxID=1213861 RepID=UPI00105355B4|nr:XRE family transcriptional regulator [Actinocrispum wychmicini]